MTGSGITAAHDGTLAIVDAFSDHAFAGNPAAVCLAVRPRDAAFMQALAAELNLSETAFVVPQDQVFGLRWFTPAVEVDLCGHATLASAHVLWECGVLAVDRPAQFVTRSGRLTATRRGDLIELDFPARPALACTAPAGLLGALGVSARFVGRSADDYLVEVDDEDTVRGLQPDILAIARLPVRGVIVTARATLSGYDCVSRFFAPAAGVAEDPVTGSAHCSIAVHWAERLGKTELSAYQASRRGGSLALTVVGDRVRLAGHAVSVVRGKLADGLGA